MSQNAARTVIAVLTVTLTTLTADVGARGRNSEVLVRIYDTGAASSSTRATAIRTAAAIFAEARIPVNWLDCSDASAPRLCAQPQRTGDLIVRIMPTLAPRKGSSESEFQLGVAVINPHTRSGEMATVYYDQARAVARRAGVDCGELLGKALAHELGHLLLKEMGHSRTGLMRAVWTDAELTSNRREDWLFAPSEQQQLQLGSVLVDDLSLTQ